MNEVGVGSRALNFLLDTLLIFLLSYGLYKWWNFYVMYWHLKFFPFYQFFYATLFVYYTVFEIAFKRSPAKWLTFTKVVNKNGLRPAWYQVLARSAVRLTIIDMFFIPFLNRPLHDALSNTRVIQA